MIAPPAEPTLPPLLPEVMPPPPQEPMLPPEVLMPPPEVPMLPPEVLTPLPEPPPSPPAVHPPIFPLGGSQFLSRRRPPAEKCRQQVQEQQQRRLLPPAVSQVPSTCFNSKHINIIIFLVQVRTAARRAAPPTPPAPGRAPRAGRPRPSEQAASNPTARWGARTPLTPRLAARIPRILWPLWMRRGERISRAERTPLAVRTARTPLVARTERPLDPIIRMAR
jgi:hypothetical protein